MCILSKYDEEYAIDHSQEILNRFLNLALNRFSWDGLPAGLTSRKMEEFLIRHGKVMFYNDENYGVMCLPCSGIGEINVYGEPTQLNVFGANGYSKIVSEDDGIVIRNNALGTNDYNDLETFASRINEIELTMDLNLNAQKTPYIILCDEKERLTFKNILQQVRKFKYAIFGSKRLNPQAIDVLNTKADYLLDKLQNQKRELMNELLTFLGINNHNVQKSERLLVDEVNANNDFILVNLDHMYDERKLACALINEKFGLNISVSKREVDFNGDIYNGAKGDSIEN